MAKVVVGMVGLVVVVAKVVVREVGCVLVDVSLHSIARLVAMREVESAVRWVFEGLLMLLAL